jgi:arylsulfatase
MIAHWPKGIAGKGRISKSLSHLVDLMPTILDAAQVDTPNNSGGKPRIPWNGHSLLPVLKGKKQIDHERLFFSHAKGRALRKENWKLVCIGHPKNKSTWELYDLSEDPNETNDLATKMPEMVKQFAKEWTQWEQSLLSAAKN